jgi:hypothetical protein
MTNANNIHECESRTESKSNEDPDQGGFEIERYNDKWVIWTETSSSCGYDSGHVDRSRQWEYISFCPWCGTELPD